MIKEYIIKGKGYFKCNVENPFNLNLQISDLQLSYGQINFTGTEKELDKFIYNLIQDESTFKMITYFEKDSKAHREYVYGSEEMFKPKFI
jgi:hypothetical protein